MRRRATLAALATLTLGAACATPERPATDGGASADTVVADSVVATPAAVPATPDLSADSVARADSVRRADSTRAAATRPRRSASDPTRASTPPVYGRDSVIQREPRMLPPRDTTRPPR